MYEDAIAVIADIHGNIWALDAVLADIDRRSIATVVDLGDSSYGPMAPRETLARLMARAIPSISGNCDREILDPGVPATPSLNYTCTQLTPEQVDWVRALPATRVLRDEILLCHGTPASDDAYLLESPTPDGSILRATAAIQEDLRDIVYPVVLCAHSHIPRTVSVTPDQIAVNPGSVGMQAYDQDTYIMETGSPHARYAILVKRDGRWQVEHQIIAYDWGAAAERARVNGRPDCALMQMTGRARARTEFG